MLLWLRRLLLYLLLLRLRLRLALVGELLVVVGVGHGGGDDAGDWAGNSTRPRPPMAVGSSAGAAAILSVAQSCGDSGDGDSDGGDGWWCLASLDGRRGAVDGNGRGGR